MTNSWFKKDKSQRKGACKHIIDNFMIWSYFFPGHEGEEASTGNSHVKRPIWDKERKKILRNNGQFMCQGKEGEALKLFPLKNSQL